MSLSPLLEKTTPTVEICLFLSRHCRAYPRSGVVCEDYSEIVQRILKHSLDFGKYPYTRVLVQDYFLALAQHNDGTNLIKSFIRWYALPVVVVVVVACSPHFPSSVHGFGSTCPHPRVVSNLVSVCLATLFSLFEYRKVDSMTLDSYGYASPHEPPRITEDEAAEPMSEQDWSDNVSCFVNMLCVM